MIKTLFDNLIKPFNDLHIKDAVASPQFLVYIIPLHKNNHPFCPLHCPREAKILMDEQSYPLNPTNSCSEIALEQ